MKNKHNYVHTYINLREVDMNKYKNHRKKKR